MFESCWAHHSTRLHLAVGETKSRSWRAIRRSNALSGRSESKASPNQVHSSSERVHGVLHVRAFVYTVFAAVLVVTPAAQTGTTIKIWKVGSPHTGDTPSTEMPPALAREAGKRGWRLSIDAFPAQGFADRFLAAAADGSAPDLLVFDNFGVMEGITTRLGTFAGIGQDPFIRNQLVRVTSSFDELLGPARGWTFLFTASSNHADARALALSAPRCAGAASAESLPADLAVHDVAAAYLTGDSGGVLLQADPERLSGLRRNPEPITVGSVAVCGGWGNERLAFVTVKASYQSDTKVGHSSLLLAFRKVSARWRLLVAASDPVSNRDFVARLPTLSKTLAREVAAGPVPAPATLRSPPNGRLPVPAAGARFGDFEWQSSTSEDVVAEIAEFTYHDDARLFLLPPRNPGAVQRVSTGQLWSTRGEWTWRVWSITSSGEIAFSESRTFVH